MGTEKIFAGLYGAWIVSELLILVVTRTRRSGGEVQDRGSLRVLWTAIVGSVTAGIWVGEANAPTIFGGADWVRTVAVAVLAAGLAIRWSAVWALGRSFSANVAILEGQTVYRKGLFRLVRHPSYTGLMVVLAGIGLHTRNWLGLALLVVPTGAALLYRISVEEDALRRAFGSDYTEYSRVTKRLIPGIY